MATAAMFGKLPLAVFNKEVDWLDDDIRVRLHDNTYVPDLDAHDYANDLSGELATAGGYTNGGLTLAGKTIAYNSGTNTVTLDATDATWNPSTLTAYYAVVEDHSPATEATRPLIGYQNFGGPITTNNGPLTLQWHANGLFNIVTSAEA